jgi:hypothetical protein
MERRDADGGPARARGARWVVLHPRG